MIIGIPKEIKTEEHRVSTPPSGAREFVERGHAVLVQAGAGAGSGFPDGEYAGAGADILESAERVWAQADMVIKVKEPQPSEYEFLHPDMVLFTYLHLAAEKDLTYALLDSGVTGIAYETVEYADGRLPLLEPMSEVAGRMATQVIAHYLEKHRGGRGVLLGGVPGVVPAHVVILGAGTVGANAAKIALGMGARVTLLDINLDRLRYLDDVLHGNLTTLYSKPHQHRQIDSDRRCLDRLGADCRRARADAGHTRYAGADAGGQCHRRCRRRSRWLHRNHPPDHAQRSDLRH